MNGAFKAVENRIQRGTSLVLGYSHFCRDVAQCVAWFDMLPEDQRWLSYQEYVQSECTFESVVDGMRRSRDDYLEYLTEWAMLMDQTNPRESIAIEKPTSKGLSFTTTVLLFFMVAFLIFACNLFATWLFMAVVR